MPAGSPSPRRERADDKSRRPRNGGGDSYRPGARDRNNIPRRPRSPAPQRKPPPVPPTEEEKQAAARAEYEKLLTVRSGGTYIPPARLRALQAQITDKTSKEYQRMAWEALKKSINGLINKVNVGNIKHIVPELFAENLVRGRGLFCRSIMKAQAASLPFTPIYAAFAAIVNTKLPQVGELLLSRLIISFRKGFKRNDKAVCLSSVMFIAHLVNQQVVHEMLVAQILLLLLQKPTDDSVEIAIALIKEVGAHLDEFSPAISNAVWTQMRTILHEADIDKRVQYMLEVAFQIRKDKYKDNPPVKEELDLIEEQDQITHRMELDAEVNVQDSLNIFKFDENWEENEVAYKKLKGEILGEGSDYDEDDEDDDESSDEEDEGEKKMEIKDQSNTDLVNLRKTIYLTIQSAIDPEEAVHKLLKVQLPAGFESELTSMVVECCSQEKAYTKFFGLIAERLAKLNRDKMISFEDSFRQYYETCHRYETNRLRNIARLFGHLFGSDAIGWYVLEAVRLNEEETTSSSRIFIKIMFQEISEELGMPKLQTRLKDDLLQSNLEGLFPRDNAKNIRFSINYFTSIGMGPLTEDMRKRLAAIPKPTLPAPPARDDDSDSVSSYSSYTGSSYSSRSRSRTPPRRAIDKRGRSLSRTPPRRGRSNSDSRSRSQSRSRSRSFSASRSPPRKALKRENASKNSPPRGARRDASYSRSRSPVRGNGAARARSYSSRGRSITRSPRSRSRSYTPSRSRSPPPKNAAPRGGRQASYARSPSPPPKKAARRNDSYSRSPPRRGRPVSKSPSPPKGRRNTSSVSSAPRKRRYSDSGSDSEGGGVPLKKRRYSNVSHGSSRGVRR